MENTNNLIFKPGNLFLFVFSLLFISIKTEKRKLSDEEFLNEITLKIKGSINQFGFVDNNSNDLYCFKGQKPYKITSIERQIIRDITNEDAPKQEINIINLNWNKAINFSYMFFGCEEILEANLNA